MRSAKRLTSVRYWFGRVHLWLGLTSGILVFIIAVTGCLYAFQEEIQDLTQPFRFVKNPGGEALPPSRLKAVAEKILPDKQIHGILYSGPDRAAQVIFFAFEPEYYDIVYVNPYTAEVLKVVDMEKNFFHIVLDGHFYLWLPPEIGQPVSATATLVFIVMLATGLIMWWPRKRKDAGQRFRIKWSARWRRMNYDLHSVAGFYVFAIALLLALTGLVWGFQWFAQGVYASAGGEKSLVYSDPYADTTKVYSGNIPAIDAVYERMKREYPEARAIEVHVPVSHQYAIAANANPDDGTYWKMDYRYFDPYTLEELPVDHIYARFDDAEIAEKLMRINYDVHTGAILGLGGKVIMFLASLLVASLPVTGIALWYGRRNKERLATASHLARQTSAYRKTA